MHERLPVYQTLAGSHRTRALKWMKRTTRLRFAGSWQDGKSSGMMSEIAIRQRQVALVFILSLRFDSSNKHWAFGLTGTILGFWFRK